MPQYSQLRLTMIHPEYQLEFDVRVGVVSSVDVPNFDKLDNWTLLSIFNIPYDLKQTIKSFEMSGGKMIRVWDIEKASSKDVPIMMLPISYLSM